ncbi:putative reverse transcriptase zinc-binding domain-containing protein [Helianthus anomalus]
MCKVGGGYNQLGLGLEAYPRSTRELQQIEELERILLDEKTSDKEDVWKWGPRNNEIISVALLRDEITKSSLEPNDVPWKHWNKWVPPKVNLFIWRAIKGRIAVKVELVKRGVQLENQICSRCNKEEESVNHLLLSCLKSRAVWWNVLIWLKLPVQMNYNSCEDLFDKIEELNGSKVWKNLIKAIFMITFWHIWKFRNDKEFNKKEGLISELVEGIKELSYLWIKERARLKNLVWERWKEFNVRDIIK